MELIIVVAVIVIILMIAWEGIFAGRESKSNENVDALTEYFREQRLKEEAESRKVEPCVINSKVKGISYRTIEEIGAARFVEKGDTLILAKEPYNPVDEYAVKVLTMAGYHIGYVSAEYSRQVSDGFEYVNSVTVTKFINGEIPYIAIEIVIGDEKKPQPKIKPKEEQDSAVERMINLSSYAKEKQAGAPMAARYNQTGYLVELTSEIGREAVKAARQLRKGDKVKLISVVTDNPEYRWGVTNQDDVHFGYIHTGNDELEQIYDRIVSISVKEINGYEDVFIAIEYSGEFCECEIPGGYSKTLYPQISEAYELRKTDPSAALLMLEPIAKKERWFDAKEECRMCYRKLKDYEKERETIIRIIGIIDDATEEDMPKKELTFIKRRMETYLDLLDYVEKKINRPPKPAKKRKAQ